MLAGGRATRLSPASRATSKQLMHVYDKPLVYYPISTLLHARINEILIISTPEQLPQFEALLGDGARWGCRFAYAEQPVPNGIASAFLIGADFIGDDDVALVLGDNIFYGVGLGEQLQQYTNPKGAVVFGLWVPDPERYGVLEFGPGGEVVAVHEKPAAPPSSYMIPGLYFYDNSVVEVAGSIEPSARGELEISEVNNRYLQQGHLEVCRLPFSTEWFDVGHLRRPARRPDVGGRPAATQGSADRCAGDGRPPRGLHHQRRAAGAGGGRRPGGRPGQERLRRAPPPLPRLRRGLTAVRRSSTSTRARPPSTGSCFLTMKQVGDDRGTVREFYRESALVGAGLPRLGPWRQVNVT